jgi:hypothetical protein
MAQNVGKRFESAIKDAIPDYVLLLRLNDSPWGFKQSNMTRFTLQQPCDYVAFDTNSKMLYFIELKSTKNRSINFDDINSDEEQGKMIKKHQILGLQKFSEYKNVNAGFIFNFRHFEDDKDEYLETTYFQSIGDFMHMINNINKKSFDEINLIQHNAIKISGEKKRVRFRWDMNEFFINMNKKYSKNMNE